MYLRDWTPSTSLSHKTPSDLWHDTSLGSPEHLHERGCAAYEDAETRHTESTLEREARMYLLAGSSARNCSWRCCGTIPSQLELQSRAERLFVRGLPVTCFSQTSTAITYLQLLSDSY